MKHTSRSMAGAVRGQRVSGEAAQARFPDESGRVGRAACQETGVGRIGEPIDDAGAMAGQFQPYFLAGDLIDVNRARIAAIFARQHRSTGELPAIRGKGDLREIDGVLGDAQLVIATGGGDARQHHLFLRASDGEPLLIGRKLHGVQAVLNGPFAQDFLLVRVKKDHARRLRSRLVGWPSGRRHACRWSRR